MRRKKPEKDSGSQDSAKIASCGSYQLRKIDEHNSNWFLEKNIPIIGSSLRLYRRYDGTFLIMLGMQYFNQGMKILVRLAAKDLYKSVYRLEPS